jgi:hypothetical protein
MAAVSSAVRSWTRSLPHALLERRGRVHHHDLAVVHDGDAVAVLSLVHVVVERVLEDQADLAAELGLLRGDVEPATRPCPPEGCTSVHSMEIVVDFPAPLGPRKPNVSSGGTSNVTPLTASRLP